MTRPTSPGGARLRGWSTAHHSRTALCAVWSPWCPFSLMRCGPSGHTATLKLRAHAWASHPSPASRAAQRPWGQAAPRAAEGDKKNHTRTHILSSMLLTLHPSSTWVFSLGARSRALTAMLCDALYSLRNAKGFTRPRMAVSQWRKKTPGVTTEFGCDSAP